MSAVPTPAEEAAARLALARGYLDRATLAHALGELEARRRRGEAAALLPLLRARGLGPAQATELEAALRASGRGSVADTVVEPSRVPADTVLDDRVLRSPAATGDGSRLLRAPGDTEVEEPPRRVGRYEVLAELGRGGMGVVYWARHVELGRDVALKLLLAGQEAGPQRRERFRLEAQAAARLRHPNIVALHEVGEDRGRPYLVMDLVRGASLQERLAGEGPFPPRTAAEVVRALASALDYAHEHLILHRDVKPANVLLGDDGQPLLTDFGLAKLGDEGSGGPTRAGQVLGTPEYMPPEQAGGGEEPLDRRADVYGLGATLYALLTGAPPFEGASTLELLARVARQDPEPPSRRRSGVDRDLETICLKCLEKEPGLRYASAGELADDLGRYLAHEPIRARRLNLLERLGKWARRNRAVAAVSAGAAGLLLVAGAGVAVWVARERARAELRAARERQGAVEEERRRLATEARRAFEEAWARLESADAASPARTGLALAAVQAAQRWHERAEGGPEAAGALFRAAMALGEVALASEQWALAAESFGQAQGLGVDDALARAAVERAGAAQRAEAERRRAAVEGWLTRVASGALVQRPDGVTDAIFGIVRYPDAQTAGLLCERLRAITARLRAAEAGLLLEASAPDALEARAGEGAIEGLERAVERGRRGEPLEAADEEALAAAAERLERRAYRALRAGEARRQAPDLRILVAARQRDVLGPGEAALARVCCESLGRIGGDAAVVEVVAAYLQAEADARRAVHAGRALCRLGGADALAHVHAARRRFGRGGAFDQGVELALSEAAGDLPLPSEDAPGYHTRGEAREAQGDLRGALADYDRTLELDPDLVCALMDRGGVREELGDFAGAMADHTRAIELDPGRSAHWSNRGVARLESGDLRGALADFTRAIELDPEAAAPYTNRGNVQLRLGDPAAALRDHSQAIARRPDDPRAWVNRADVRRMQGDLAGARVDVERALALRPDLLEAVLGRALVLLAEGAVAEAIQDLERARDLAPDRSLVWDALGEARLRQGDMAGADAAYTRAIELAPENSAVWCHRGVARHRQGRLEEARADLERGLALDPERAPLWSNLALVHLDEGDLEGALAASDRAVALAPDDVVARQNRALIHERRGEVDAALADYAAAIELAPRRAEAWLARGTLWQSRGDLARARADLDRAVELGSDDPQAWCNRGVVRQAQGDLEGALADLTRAVELDPRNPLSWSNRATVHLALQRDGEACDDATTAVGLDPDEPAHRFNRGLALARLGRLDEAERALSRALELAPKLTQAWQLRAQIRLTAGDEPGAAADLERFLELVPEGRQADEARAVLRRLGRSSP